MAFRGAAIMGKTTGTISQMRSVVAKVNPAAIDLAPLYLSLGAQLGVRGDFAFAQAIHETDYFRFTGVVRPSQNNFCGLGATGPGNPGHSFDTPEAGVLAHLQHLFAYASTDPLPPGIPLVDPRFSVVARGSAPFAADLNGRWAVPGTGYGERIDQLLGDILMAPLATEPYAITPAYLSPTSPNRPGRCYSAGCWEYVQGIVVHRTASPSMDAYAIQRYFDTSPDGRRASSNFVVDDKVILQLMPIGEVSYHTDSVRNLSYLGIETCEHNWGTPEFQETYRKLVWLVGYLSRTYQLPILQVTGHFWWDPVNRPYDPTYMGWNLSKGKATGIFDWNTLVRDVAAQTEQAPEVVSVRVIQQVVNDCVEGLLLNQQTYVPIRSYTACINPDAAVHWDDAARRVEVDLPPTNSTTGK